MRRLLYISPYFPPQSQVGALRPLKFVRHLRDHGWHPIVLCDLWPGAAVADDLAARVPGEVEVVRDYSRRARVTEARWRAGEHARSGPRAPAAAGLLGRLPPALANPELVPLGEHSVHMPHALGAGARMLRERAFDAILVNADPYAALLVGARLAARFDLPLVIDLRDPWAPCALRRPRRPAPVRALVDRMERHVVHRAARVICNTETARRDYLVHYPDVAAGRFATIRNHGDPGLLDPVRAPAPAPERFTMLFLGRFRRFLEGRALLVLLAELRRRGHPPGALQLLVTGDIPAGTWQEAAARGVAGYLRQGAFVPYPAIGSAMAAADLLVLLSQSTSHQRIPAKLYDYLLGERPLLALSGNPELREIVARTGAGAAFAPGDIPGAADFVERLLRGPRRPVLPRQGAEELTSAAATRRLAAILDEAVTRPRNDPPRRGRSRPGRRP